MRLLGLHKPFNRATSPLEASCVLSPRFVRTSLATWPRTSRPHQSADGRRGVPEARLRAELHKHGVVENIHPVSHKKTKKAEARARDFADKAHAIEGYPNWHANAHREISCRCGKGVARKIHCDKDGEAIVRVEGKCLNGCGSISIKSGDCYFTEDDRFRSAACRMRSTRAVTGPSATR